MRTLTRRWLLAVFAVVVLASWLVWEVGGLLSEPELGSIGDPPASSGARNVTFASASGSLIHCWFARGEPARGAMLLSHGVHGDRRDMLRKAAI